ncbi:hypothetical protein HGA89_03500, partial [bacterium]|nr:hypothetical protein [bacterium]
AKAITPVPGGVGPMTRAMLMVNTVRASEIAFEKAQAKKRAKSPKPRRTW